MASTAEDVSRLYEHVPADGSPIGNGMLRRLLGWDEGRYELAKIPLVRAVRLRQGPGRSGTLRRSDAIGALVEPGAVDQGGISPTPDVVKAERACQSNVIVGPLAFATGKAPKNPREQPADDAFAAEHQTASVPTVVKEPPSDHPEIEPSRASKSAFTRSGQIVKAIMAMTGMLRSMPSERPLNDDEIAHCHTFVKEHWLLFERSGKAGVLHDFLDAIVDVVLTDAEREHLLASLAQADEAYYDTITRHLQQLHGLLGFAAADRRMEPHEVTALRGWVTYNIELVGTWPYDDIAVLVEDLAKQPTEQAAQALLRYAKSFEGRSLSTSTPVNVDTGESLFTTNPRPICPGRVVSVTGGSIHMPRSAIGRLLASVGARWNRTPSTEVDLILVCGQGNQAWAHGNYGRKLEHVIDRRRRGEAVDVVDESTFWRLMMQAGAELPFDLVQIASRG